LLEIQNTSNRSNAINGWYLQYPTSKAMTEDMLKDHTLKAAYFKSSTLWAYEKEVR